jgi:hypothetical protein
MFRRASFSYAFRLSPWLFGGEVLVVAGPCGSSLKAGWAELAAWRICAADTRHHVYAYPQFGVETKTSEETLLRRRDQPSIKYAC